MTQARITATQAETLAMAVVQEGHATAMAAHLVERLDGGNPYYLIFFGEKGSEGAIVAVDALAGAIASSAKLARVEGSWLLDQAKAAELAGCTQPLAARLVWAPSRATRSPLYPLWEITRESGRVYIDCDGRLWDSLPPAGPG